MKWFSEKEKRGFVMNGGTDTTDETQKPAFLSIFRILFQNFNAFAEIKKQPLQMLPKRLSLPIHEGKLTYSVPTQVLLAP